MVSDLQREEKTEVSEEVGGVIKGKWNHNARLPQIPPHLFFPFPHKTPGQFIDNGDRYMPD